MAYLARLHAPVRRCVCVNDNWSFGSFHVVEITCSALIVVILPAFIVFFLKLGIGTCRRIVYSLIFWHLFSLCVSSFQRPSLSLFLSASPPLLLRQHLTLDIQLLAGRSTVIPFRAAPFSSGLSQAIQITSSAAFRVAASAKCCFQTFLEGHHLIWSPRA